MRASWKPKAYMKNAGQSLRNTTALFSYWFPENWQPDKRQVSSPDKEQGESPQEAQQPEGEGWTTWQECLLSRPPRTLASWSSWCTSPASSSQHPVIFGIWEIASFYRYKAVKCKRKEGNSTDGGKATWRKQGPSQGAIKKNRKTCYNRHSEDQSSPWKFKYMWLQKLKYPWNDKNVKLRISPRK